MATFSRRQTKQEFRKQKELEEGRKAGTVPAMTDVETGRDINPHIPHYISNAPWYVNASGPTLKHQRPHPERQITLSGIYETYNKGVKDKTTTKYRQGACENCGAITHKKKDCFERPRKIGAKYSNKEIAPDELIPDELQLSYDAKHDRWAGYDAQHHSNTMIKEYERLEEARKTIKAAEILDKQKQGDGNEEQPDEADGDRLTGKDDEEDYMDEDKYAETADMPGVKVHVDSSSRITVRNLRIREDTAKYLYNLDPESAHYDPKSRAMRQDPFENVPVDKRPLGVAFMGDTFKRFTGEVIDANQAQVFAWEAQSKGLDVHALAEPTKLEALRKGHDDKKKTMKRKIESSILEKYGGQEHLTLDDETKKLIYDGQTEHYTEYNRKGQLIKGQEKPIVRSRYDEDVYPNNHTSVFGSYWRDGRWGYKCCRNFIKNSYCTTNTDN